jgi:hypothetical protein
MWIGSLGVLVHSHPRGGDQQPIEILDDEGLAARLFLITHATHLIWQASGSTTSSIPPLSSAGSQAAL